MNRPTENQAMHNVMLEQVAVGLGLSAALIKQMRAEGTFEAWMLDIRDTRRTKAHAEYRALIRELWTQLRQEVPPPINQFVNPPITGGHITRKYAYNVSIR